MKDIFSKLTHDPIESLKLGFLVFITLVTRLTALGYSHFYGDETKTLFLDKTVSAFDFFFSQRKAPLQFITAWIVEKVTGGFNEGLIRLPFALAGALCVLVFYLLLKRWFGKYVALVGALIFSLNGFYIAFSRTAQYQSLYLLFGLLALYFLSIWHEKGKKFLFFAGLSYGLSLLAHYDALLFLIPIFGLLLVEIKKNWKLVLMWFVIPVFILAGAFYIPYTLNEHFYDNTFGYLQRRVVGKEYAPNNSLYTMKVYTPFAAYFLFFVPAFFAFCSKNVSKKVLAVLLLWVLSGFALFEFVFKNPGTHIHNYVLPLIIISAVGIEYIYTEFKRLRINIVFWVLIVGVGIGQVNIFSPALSNGYPWSLNVPDKSYHLFLYGFPYNRAWDQIGAYLKTQNRVKGFYTNDNTVVAAYYLHPIPVTSPGSNFLPHYYVDVVSGQEFKLTDPEYLLNYELEKTFSVDGVIVSKLYKLKAL